MIQRLVVLGKQGRSVVVGWMCQEPVVDANASSLCSVIFNAMAGSAWIFFTTLGCTTASSIGPNSASNSRVVGEMLLGVRYFAEASEPD